MKKILLFVLIGFASISLTNAQSWVFAEQFSSTGDVDPVDIKVDGNGDIYVLGDYEQALTIGGLPALTYSGTQEDIFFCKFDELGTALWARRIGGDAREFAGGLTIDPSNNIYIVGSSRSPELGFEGGTTTLLNTDSVDFDAFLAKYDGSGSLLFADSVFWGSDVERLRDVTYDADRDYVVVVGMFKDTLKYSDGGEQFITASGPKDQILARFDPNGTFLDIQTFRGSHNQSIFKNVNNSVVGGAVNGYFVSGDLRGTIWFTMTDSVVGETSAMDILVVRFEDDLTYDWSRTGGGASWEHINSSGSDGNGNIYFTGKASSDPIVLDSTATLSSAPRPRIGGPWDFLIAKYSRNGNLQWFRRDGGIGEDDAFGMDIRGERLLYSGNIELGGNVQSGFAMYDIDGNLIAKDSITGDGDETGLNVAFDLSGDSTLVIGNFDGISLNAGPDLQLTNTTLTGETDGFFVKYGFKFSVFEVDKTNIKCNGESTGSIEVETQFGTEPITYEWDPGDYTGSSASNLPADDYTITARDNEGREATIIITITEPPPIIITEDAINPTSCHTSSTAGTKNDGEVFMSVTGGTPPFNFLWSPNGGTSEDNSSLTAGANAVTITDVNGCVKDTTFMVPQPDSISYAGSSVDSIVDPPGNNGAVNLNIQGGTPAYSYDWSGPAGFSSTDGTIIDLGTNGIYDLSTTDANLCIQDTSFVVSISTGITVSVETIINVECKDEENGGASVSVIGGSGNFLYEWTKSGGGDVGGNSPEISGLPAGTYFIKVTDTDDILLTNEAEVIINEPDNSMLAAFDSTRHISCYGETDGYLSVIVIGGWGNNTYQWIPSGSTTFFANDLEPAEHKVTITDAGGCEETLDREIEEPEELVVNIVPQEHISCNGVADGALEAEADGGIPGYAYVWDDPGHQNTAIATNLGAGDYRVDVADDQGCTAFNTYTLNEPAVLSLVSLGRTWDGVDSLGSVTLTIAGGSPDYTYSISGGKNDTVAESKVPLLEYTFTDLQGGDYDISIVDQCGARIDTVLLPPLKIEDLQLGYDLLLYPNPSTGLFTVELNNSDREDIDLEIINLMGQRIFRQKYESFGEARFIQTIDLGELARGAYFMRINGLPVKAKLMIE